MGKIINMIVSANCNVVKLYLDAFSRSALQSSLAAITKFIDIIDAFTAFSDTSTHSPHNHSCGRGSYYINHFDKPIHMPLVHDTGEKDYFEEEVSGCTLDKQTNYFDSHSILGHNEGYAGLQLRKKPKSMNREEKKYFGSTTLTEYSGHPTENQTDNYELNDIKLKKSITKMFLEQNELLKKIWSPYVENIRSRLKMKNDAKFKTNQHIIKGSRKMTSEHKKCSADILIPKNFSRKSSRSNKKQSDSKTLKENLQPALVRKNKPNEREAALTSKLMGLTHSVQVSLLENEKLTREIEESEATNATLSNKLNDLHAKHITCKKQMNSRVKRLEEKLKKKDAYIHRMHIHREDTIAELNQEHDEHIAEIEKNNLLSVDSLKEAGLDALQSFKSMSDFCTDLQLRQDRSTELSKKYASVLTQEIAFLKLKLKDAGINFHSGSSEQHYQK